MQKTAAIKKGLALDNINAIGMIAQDSVCIFNILEVLIDAISKDKKEPEYGQSEGFSTFITMNLIQDLSVFAYEMLKVLPDMKQALDAVIVGQRYFENLEKMRNAIHIRKPYGSYKERAKRIVENINSDFRNSHFDLSLMYRITKPNTVFLSSNINFYHMTVDIDKSDMRGVGIKEYAQNTTAFFKAISQAFPSKTNYIEPRVGCPAFSSIQIEMFDYTLSALQDMLGLSEPSAIRVMLMHSYVSFINAFFEMMSADSLTEIDDCWLFFLAKLYSIRYDEVMDSFDSLLSHSNEGDKEIIVDLFDFKGFDRKPMIREFAQKLRNLIHYKMPKYPPIYKNGNYCVDIERVYLDSVNLASVYEFRELFYALRFDMKMMQLRFRKLFNIDYPLSSIQINLARGGKVL